MSDESCTVYWKYLRNSHHVRIVSKCEKVPCIILCSIFPSLSTNSLHLNGQGWVQFFSSELTGEKRSTWKSESEVEGNIMCEARAHACLFVRTKTHHTAARLKEMGGGVERVWLLLLLCFSERPVFLLLLQWLREQFCVLCTLVFYFFIFPVLLGAWEVWLKCGCHALFCDWTFFSVSLRSDRHYLISSIPFSLIKSSLLGENSP